MTTMSNGPPLSPGLYMDPYNIVFGPNANCTLEICPVEYSVYGYRPSLAANAFFIALYAAAGIIHTLIGIRWRQRWFMGCMLAGAINAILGYSGRVMLYYNPFSFTAFMIQIVCVTTGPVYFCAAIYITLSMTINHLSPSLARFNPHFFYYFFIPADIFSLVLQAAGGALSTTSSGASQIGVDLALAGMSFQVFTLLAFCGFFIDYLVRYLRSDRYKIKYHGEAIAVTLKLFFGFMGAAVVLILTRCAYRLAELHGGYRSGGWMVRDEGLFIALEGCTILLAVYCLVIGHPGFGFRDGDLNRDGSEVGGHAGNLKSSEH